MFCIHLMTDVIKIPACDLQYYMTTTSTTSATTNEPTKKRKKRSLLPMIHREIDRIYPNRVLTDIGLVISRYYHMNPIITNTSGEAMRTMTSSSSSTTTKLNGTKRKRGDESSNKAHLKINNNKRQQQRELQNILQKGTQILGNDNHKNTNHSNCGTCVGSSVHYKVQFPMIVFRPFIGEIITGTIYDMNSNGILVALGNFFSAIYIPSYNMLHPSIYVSSSSSESHHTASSSGIWVWTPSYDDDDDDDHDNNNDSNNNNNEPLRYEMHIGDEIRVRVKSIHYTKTTTTAKGKQQSMITLVSPTTTTMMTTATTAAGTTSTITANTVLSNPTTGTTIQRQRSSSITAMNRNDGNQPANSASNTNNINNNSPTATNTATSNIASFPTAMHIIASICEDGLGLTSWWTNTDNEDDDDYENDNNDTNNEQDQQQPDNDSMEYDDQVVWESF